MLEFSVAEVKSKLSEVIRLVEQGEKVTVTRRGKPVVVMSKPKQVLASRSKFRENVKAEGSLVEELLNARAEVRY